MKLNTTLQNMPVLPDLSGSIDQETFEQMCAAIERDIQALEENDTLR